jgi:xylan 1,4-beta-xylosidase
MAGTSCPELEGLDAASYELRHLRVDTTHSNIAAVWEGMRGDADWPDEDAWRKLRRADRLESLYPPTEVTPVNGAVETRFELPLPSMSLLELVPKRP